MSSPFSVAQIVSQPIWSKTAVPASTFSPFPTVNAGTDEVGYGEGGYGEGGYDTPGTSIQPAPTPKWTVGSSR